MKTTKKWLAMILAAVMMLCMALPAAAEETAATETPAEAANTFTSSDGVLSIELPNESWKEIMDPAHWIVLSDGANMITIDHFSNGEKLPETAIADEHYVNVYQAVFSTQNEVFITTGYTVDAAKIPEICNMIISAKILKYDTKLAVNRQNTSTNEFKIIPINKTMYATDDISIRTACSTADRIIGQLAKGSEVKVLGKVTRNGQDFGWYQIEYGKGVGYVSSSFISETAPAAAPEKPAVNYTGTAKTIYDQNGNAVTIYEATDGYWYDNAGNQYNWITEYEFSNSNGNTYSVNQPVNSQESGLVPTGEPFTVYWLNGNTTTLTPYSDGSYYSESWVQYWYNGNGTYSGADGSTLYVEEVPLDDEGVIPLYSQGSGRPVVITETDDGYYDAEGNEYHEQEDGTYTDNDGAVYADDYNPEDPS